MAGTALKRLMTEYKGLLKSHPEGILAGPISEDDFFEWEAIICGPGGSPYEDGVFASTLSFPRDYPLSPPRMKFTSPMYHPNIYPDGRVCISILHPPGDDPMGYELSSERWSPVQSVEKILLSVVSMLSEPNDESGANIDASSFDQPETHGMVGNLKLQKMYREDRAKFNAIVDLTVRKSLALA